MATKKWTDEVFAFIAKAIKGGKLNEEDILEQLDKKWGIQASSWKTLQGAFRRNKRKAPGPPMITMAILRKKAKSQPEDFDGVPVAQKNDLIIDGLSIEPTDCPLELRDTCIRRAKRHFAGKSVHHRTNSSNKSEEHITFRFNRHSSSKHDLGRNYKVTVRKAA